MQEKLFPNLALYYKFTENRNKGRVRKRQEDKFLDER
jgi:hypothetical protein